jgi:2-methylisocitrate lyase-like PEP mutase family enzyme
VEGPKLANMIQNGKTPVLPPKKLQEMGYTIVAYPMALLSASIRTMRNTLDILKKGEDITHLLADFDETKTVVGFDAYYEEEDRYANCSWFSRPSRACYRVVLNDALRLGDRV